MAASRKATTELPRMILDFERGTSTHHGTESNFITFVSASCRPKVSDLRSVRVKG
jgi:hypothetical protein